MCHSYPALLPVEAYACVTVLNWFGCCRGTLDARLVAQGRCLKFPWQTSGYSRRDQLAQLPLKIAVAALFPFAGKIKAALGVVHDVAQLMVLMLGCQFALASEFQR